MTYNSEILSIENLFNLRKHEICYIIYFYQCWVVTEQKVTFTVLTLLLL